MNKKYTAILMALLGVSLGVQAQSCRLAYESVITDPTIGSAAVGFELDSTTPTLTKFVKSFFSSQKSKKSTVFEFKFLF